MGQDDVLRFIYRWLYDVEGTLRNQLEALKADLVSDDEAIQAKAADEVESILDWLYPPVAPLPAVTRAERAQAALSDVNLTPEEKLTAVRRAIRSTGRRRGRPRDETSQHAIRALTLHYATSMSWREIALKLRGCAHDRPNLNRSCEACGEAMRNAAARLEQFLKSIDFHSDDPIPMGRTLDAASQRELLRLVSSPESEGDPRR